MEAGAGAPGKSGFLLALAGPGLPFLPAGQDFRDGSLGAPHKKDLPGKESNEFSRINKGYILGSLLDESAGFAGGSPGESTPGSRTGTLLPASGGGRGEKPPGRVGNRRGLPYLPPGR